MNTVVISLFIAFSAAGVLGSLYHGPTARPVVLHDGYLADTHEVAAAKSAHLATLSHQAHGYSYGGDHGYAGSNGHSQGGNHGYAGSYGHSHGDLRYHGPTAVPHVLHDGHIADTHEVAAAKAEHFAAVAKARSHGGYSVGGSYHEEYSSEGSEHGGYSGEARQGPNHGPLFRPVLLQSGYLADTHDVAAAKERHLHAHHSSQSNYHNIY